MYTLQSLGTWSRGTPLPEHIGPDGSTYPGIVGTDLIFARFYDGSIEWRARINFNGGLSDEFGDHELRDAESVEFFRIICDKKG